MATLPTAGARQLRTLSKQGRMQRQGPDNASHSEKTYLTGVQLILSYYLDCSKRMVMWISVGAPCGDEQKNKVSPATFCPLVLSIAL